MLLIDPMIYFDKDENEVWKPLVMENIRSGEYLISNFGNIYDLINQKYISPHINKNNGYVYIHLRTTSPSINGSLLLHRVMAENFVGEKHYGQDQVNHKNGIKTDNRVENLEWCNNSMNQLHAFANGLQKGAFMHPNSKLTYEQVKYIKESHKPHTLGYGITTLAKKFNVCESSIKQILDGRSYRNIN